MAAPKLKSAAKSAPADQTVVAEVAGFQLVKSGRARKLPAPAPAKAMEASQALLTRVGKALRAPGIQPRPAVKNAYVYAAYPADLTKVIERAPDGTKRIGRLVQGRFIPSKTAG